MVACACRGAGLWSDDTAREVRAVCREAVDDGLSDEEATEQVLAELAPDLAAEGQVPRPRRRSISGGWRIRGAVDPGRLIGRLDRNVFGGFVEHLGRCIYGGDFDEGSILSAACGYLDDQFQGVSSGRRRSASA
jgi:hypothetical protein